MHAKRLSPSSGPAVFCYIKNLGRPKAQMLRMCEPFTILRILRPDATSAKLTRQGQVSLGDNKVILEDMIAESAAGAPL